MQAYQNLVDDDAEGFIEVRRRLDAWFPKLEHIATSAMGGKIGPHLPDFTVTPQVCIDPTCAIYPTEYHIHYYVSHMYVFDSCSPI